MSRLCHQQLSNVCNREPCSEFVWEEYLQETGVKAVPPTAFKHVSNWEPFSEFVWEEYLQETGVQAVPPTAFKHK